MTRTPLVGREHELDVLAAHLDAATAGDCRVVLVAGEPGIGKTRLLEEAAARARAVGATVLRGGAIDAAGMPPYLPFLEALGGYIRAAPVERLRAQTGTTASILARILPELVARLGDLAPAYPLPPEQARLRLYEAVSDFLLAVARGGAAGTGGGEQGTEPAPAAGLLLVLDDLQWADVATFDLLCHVARALPLRVPAPLPQPLILGAYREGEVRANPALERALAELARLRLLTTLALPPLTGAEVAALAASQLDAPPDETVAAALAAQSEGNPFFAEELLRGWVESGMLVRRERTWAFAGPRPSDPSLAAVPSSIAVAVRRRVARLSPDVARRLQTAAIAGRAFAAAVLAAVLDEDGEVVEERLQEAVRAGLLRVEGDGRYAFTHDKVRECLYAEVTAARRARLHSLIGRALEKEAAAPTPGRLAEMAFHFVRSGDRERGARYARAAGEAALAAYAPEEAARHFRTALDLMPVEVPERGAVLAGLGEALTFAGREREAAALLAEARTWFAAAGDRVAAARAAHHAGRAHARVEAHREARAAFEDALALLGEGPSAERVEVLVDLASLLGVSVGDIATGAATAEEATVLARGLGGRPLAKALRTLGALRVRQNLLHEGIALLEEALALAEAADDPMEAAECCGHLAMACAWRGDIPRAMAVTRRRIAFAERCHDRYELRHVWTMLAVGALISGDPALAAEHLARARTIVDELASPEPLAFLDFCESCLAYYRNDHATALRLMERAVAAFRAIGSGALIWYLGYLCWARLAAGDEAGARAAATELEGLIARQPPGTMPTAEPLTYLGELALALDDRPWAARLEPLLRPFAGQFHDVLVDRLLGTMAALRGDWDAAARSLAAAEATARQNGITIELAMTLAARAELELLHRGPTAEARRLWEEACARFDALDMRGRTRRRYETLPGLSARPARRALPAGLSEREAEVLRLVVAGKSNREIAQELVLSEKTVANHLTSIFTKTGAQGRAAATAFAVRHGLA
jgi:DNA-binding CsgD family transcriptional regulator/tetratricopeptide (TPR) repeat protein